MTWISTRLDFTLILYDCNLQSIFFRWNYTGEEPVPPPYSLYTMFTLKDTFFAAFVLLAIHLVVLVIAKTITSAEFRSVGDFTNKFLHIVENSNFATPYVDWDDTEGVFTKEEYKKRFMATVIEMSVTLTINTISSVIMMAPLWYTGKRVQVPSPNPLDAF